MNGNKSSGCGRDQNRRNTNGAGGDCKINQVTGRVKTDHTIVATFLPPSLPLSLPAPSLPPPSFFLQRILKHSNCNPLLPSEKKNKYNVP